MQCVNTLEANKYAELTGLLDKLASQKNSYINIEAERIISSYSFEYQYVISLMYEDEKLINKCEQLNQKIINTNDLAVLIQLKTELRELIKGVACDYVERKINKARE